MKAISTFSVHQFLLLLTGKLALSVPSAPATEIGMMTGSKVGTYIQFGQAIAEQVKTEGLAILAKEYAGSIASIRRMNSRENAALGIVQSHVLAFLSRSDNRELQKNRPAHPCRATVGSLKCRKTQQS